VQKEKAFNKLQILSSPRPNYNMIKMWKFLPAPPYILPTTLYFQNTYYILADLFVFWRSLQTPFLCASAPLLYCWCGDLFAEL